MLGGTGYGLINLQACGCLATVVTEVSVYAFTQEEGSSCGAAGQAGHVGAESRLAVSAVLMTASRSQTKRLPQLMLPLLLPLLLCSAFSCVLQVEKNTTLIIGSANKEQLGAYCAEIRRQRPPEPYKGKGIRYAGEVIKLKEGKGGGKKK